MSKINIGSIEGQQVNIGEVVHAVQNINDKERSSSLIKVLHIVGDKTFGELDDLALKHAGVDVVTVKSNSYLELEKEIFRQRQDNKIIKRIHISAHGHLSKGILLNQTWYDFKQWFALFDPKDEIEIVFLAACQTIELADTLAGLAKYIVATTVDIPNEDAMLATQVFWRYIGLNYTAEEAFERMRHNIPKFAKYIRLRGV